MLPFKSSEPLSIGVELELQILNTEDFNLAADAADLLRRVQRHALGEHLKPEITQSMVEVNSSVHTCHAELLAELRAIRDLLSTEARRMDIAVAGGGAHPFQKWSERRIYPFDRFRFLSEQYGYLAKQFTVFGQHIHVGCPSGDDALYLTHALARFVPHFIAIAASSPYYQGVDTAFDSSRLSIVNAFPLCGTAPLVSSWNDFCAYYEHMEQLGIVKSMKDFYWDIRPKPEYGTVEIRVCDTPLTVEKAADLAAYAQALAGWLLRERPFEPSRELYLTYSYNRFQSCRYGLSGTIIDPLKRNQGTIAGDVFETARAIADQARALGGAEAVNRIAVNAANCQNDADWLRRMFADTKSLSDTVQLQAVRWMEEESTERGRRNVV